MPVFYANMAKADITSGVNNFVDIDRLVARVNSLILQNDECQKKMKKLEFDIYQIQERLEHYYALSREQAKIIELNERLHQRTIALLSKSYSDTFRNLRPEE